MLLDANIFLEAQLAQQHAGPCELLLAKVRDGKARAIVTDFHIDSVVVVMENCGRGPREVVTFLASLVLYKGLTIYRLGLYDRIKAALAMRDLHLDYDDALALQASRQCSVNRIISYDEHFDSVNSIRRVVPEDLA